MKPNLKKLKSDAPPGRPPLGSAKRTHCVSLRLNSDELAEVTRLAGGASLGNWLRRSALGVRPIPQVNLFVAAELGKIGVNLNQLARRANSSGGVVEDVTEVRGLMRELADLLKFAKRESIHLNQQNDPEGAGNENT